MEQSQYLFIHTDKCEGTPSRFSFTVPQNLVKCEPTERMRVSLVKWTCRHDWNVVRTGNNSFTVTYNSVETTITVPTGNYTYAEYASKIQTLMNGSPAKANMGVTTGTIKCEYLSPQCHLKFTFPNTATRIFTFPADYLGNYGMSQSVNTISNTILESDAPLDFYKDQERLYIYCEGLHPQSSHRSLIHADNTVSELEGQKNLLASVLVNAYPFETIVWENDGGMYGHHLQDTHLFGRLNFVIKTITGREADYLPDSHLVLKIEKIQNRRLIEEGNRKIQEDIRDYLRLMFLSQNMPPDLPEDAQQNPA